MTNKVDKAPLYLQKPIHHEASENIYRDGPAKTGVSKPAIMRDNYVNEDQSIEDPYDP